MESGIVLIIRWIQPNLWPCKAVTTDFALLISLNELPNRSKLRGITSLCLTHFEAQLRSTAP